MIARVSTAEAAKLLGLDRATLDRMIARAPRTLKGAPLRVGEGRRRVHYRWDPARLGEWLDAYTAWDASRGQRRRAA